MNLFVARKHYPCLKYFTPRKGKLQLYLSLKLKQSEIACILCADCKQNEIVRREKKRRLSSRFASPFTPRLCIRIEAPCNNASPQVFFSYLFERRTISFERVFPKQILARNCGERTQSWRACRTTKKKTRARLIRRESLASSLSLSLSMLRKFKLLSHKRGIKKFVREAVLRGAKSAHERGVPLFLLFLRILARPLTEFDHLSARCNSQKK